MVDGSSLKPSSDEKYLLRRIRQGESERFADLISWYQPHVIRIVSLRVPADQAKEVVHGGFVRAYFSLAHFPGSVAFDHWFVGIAVRAWYDFWRAKKRDEVRVSVLTDDHHRWIEQIPAARSDDQFHDQLQKREAAEVLEWALKYLSPGHRTDRQSRSDRNSRSAVFRIKGKLSRS